MYKSWVESNIQLIIYKIIWEKDSNITVNNKKLPKYLACSVQGSDLLKNAIQKLSGCIFLPQGIPRIPKDSQGYPKEPHG